jgi:hypothetical protein
MTMSHRRGLATGRKMEAGMGIVEQGHALAENLGPSLRSLSVDGSRAIAGPH